MTLLMSTDTDIRRDPDDLLTGAPLDGGVSLTVADFLKDVRRVKRFTQIGVYLGLVASLPLYRLAFAFSWVQLLAVFGVCLLIATTAIEGAFIEIFKLRKRSAYPGAVALQLGALSTFDAACEAITKIMQKLLHLKCSFLTLRNDSGFLSLVALGNLSRVDADRYLRMGAAAVQSVLTAREPVTLDSSNDLLAEAMLAPGQKVVFIPVQSFQKTIGVMGLIARESNADVRDRELLASLGTAIGVSLENLRQRDELRTLAAVDELTKVYNRRHFFDQLGREIAFARRYGAPASVLVLDLDGLKKLNDSFGHSLGDEALRTLAQRLVRYSRASDVVARLGGDEFAVILPRTDRAGAAEIAQRLQTSVEGDPLAAVPGRELHISVSCGSASFPEDGDDAEQILRLADGCMYAAKAARRRAPRKRS